MSLDLQQKRQQAHALLRLPPKLSAVEDDEELTDEERFERIVSPVMKRNG